MPKKKKTMPNKKQKLKKINKVKSLLKQVTDTTQKINFIELLLRRLLNPIHLLNSENPIIKELASTIHDIQQDQFNYFIENKMQLERMERNAASAYRATRDDSYLEIITEIIEVITNTNLAYDATQLPEQLPDPTQIGYQNFIKHCFYLKHGINNETVQFLDEAFSPNKTK